MCARCVLKLFAARLWRPEEEEGRYNLAGLGGRLSQEMARHHWRSLGRANKLEGARIAAGHLRAFGRPATVQRNANKMHVRPAPERFNGSDGSREAWVRGGLKAPLDIHRPRAISLTAFGCNYPAAGGDAHGAQQANRMACAPPKC